MTSGKYTDMKARFLMAFTTHLENVRAIHHLLILVVKLILKVVVIVVIVVMQEQEHLYQLFSELFEVHH